MWMVVDRTARDRLAAPIEEFLADRIGAFEFDDRISAVAAKTDGEGAGERRPPGVHFVMSIGLTVLTLVHIAISPAEDVNRPLSGSSFHAP